VRRAIEAVAKGKWPEAEAVGAVTLDYDARHRRRIRLDGVGDGPVLLDLPQAVALRDGDGLRIDSGGWIAVHAAPEDLIEVRAPSAHEMNRLAWHLGNRHCPAEIHADRFYIRPDHVLEAMLRGRGATLTPVRRAFDPEGGAYAEGHGSHSHRGHGNG
jgi:urease accessory protein